MTPPSLRAFHALALCLAACLLTRSAAAQTDPLEDAIRDMHATDGDGQWFSFSLALMGAAPGLALGGIALVDGDVLGLEGDDAFVRGSALGMILTGGGMIAHGLMRVDERKASAATTRILLDDKRLLSSAGRLYLRDRAQKAHATRLWGGILTTLHGASTALLGVAAIMDDDPSDGVGYVMLPLGVIGMSIGAVHFFGDTHPERLLHGLPSKSTALKSWSVTPIASLGALATMQGSLVFRGRF